MPRPRFERLSDAKRKRILEAAAKEFSALGYENASLNRILQDARISKGAAYYYFDDKLDLYLTTLWHYKHELWETVAFDIDQFSADEFWVQVALLYKRLFVHYYERPWILGIAKSAAPTLMDALVAGPMADLIESAQGLLNQVSERGRELGLIRSDLLDDLLQAWVMGVDLAHDHWLMAHWADMSATDVEIAAERMTDALRRLLEP
jgi:AcrR family transcriptional regulator